MLIYNVIRSNVALSTTTDFFTLVTNGTRSILILEIDAEGDATASTYNECGIYRVTTTGATGGGAITPTAIDQPQAANVAQFSVWTTWTTQPAVGALIHNIPINANGQRYFWRANPNMSNAIPVQGSGPAIAGTCSVGRSISGTSNISLRLQIAEF
jgi:hypothetical protein